jgi:hypothetical protein
LNLPGDRLRSFLRQRHQSPDRVVAFVIFKAVDDGVERLL